MKRKNSDLKKMKEKRKDTKGEEQQSNKSLIIVKNLFDRLTAFPGSS